MSAQPSVIRRRGSIVHIGLALTTGALALVLAACGGSSTPAASAPATKPAAAPASGANTPPGTFGTAAAVSATNVEVQNPQSGQVTVNFNSSTLFTNTVPGTLADVKMGSCVAVIASSGNMQTMTARTVSISQPTAKGCTAGGAFGGGAGGRGGFAGRGGASRTPRPSGSARPSGAANPNAGRIAFGSVTAVRSNGFTVQDVARGKQAAQSTVVVTAASTTFTQTVKATASALAVGDCVAAVGAADDTGAVTAKSIVITKPTANGCAGGFGGRNFRGAGNGGGEGSGAPSQIPGGGNG